MFPKVPAASSAACFDRPIFEAAPSAHDEMTAADVPNTWFDLLTDSERSLAAPMASPMKSPILTAANAAPIPATAPLIDDEKLDPNLLPA